MSIVLILIIAIPLRKYSEQQAGEERGEDVRRHWQLIPTYDSKRTEKPTYSSASDPLPNTGTDRHRVGVMGRQLGIPPSKKSQQTREKRKDHMASGIYAQRARQPLPIRRQWVPIVPTQGVLAIAPLPVRWRSWMLYPIGAVCVLAILILTGVREHSASSSYLATGGGQTYVISVGGDQAATIPTPTVQPQATSYTVVASPSVQADFINRVLLTYHSPAAGKGQALYDLGVEHGIDPAFALAFFMHESTFGTRGEATKSRSLGNLRCIPNFRCEDNFAQFNTWEDGFKAWYQLIGNLYVAQWKLTTVDQIIPKYAPTADHNNEQAYIAALKYAVDTWHTGQYIVR